MVESWGQVTLASKLLKLRLALIWVKIQEVVDHLKASASGIE